MPEPEFDPLVVVAVDYDGTIIDAHGEVRPKAVRWIRRFAARGWMVVLWTCNPSPVLPAGLPLQRPEEVRRGAGRKLKADVYIDDRNPGGCQWALAYIKGRRIERGRSVVTHGG